MSSILKGIQRPVMKYANIISKVLKVEVEIADSDLIRIAGTGIYKNKINRSMSKEGYVYKTALKTGKLQIINNPGKDELCFPCPKRDICEEKFEMCTPIKLGSEIIGVIGLVCTDEFQKERLMNDFETSKSFLEQISDFISITAYENIEKSREQTLLKSLNFVIDKMDEGIIILNKNNKVVQINRKAVNLLNFVDSSFIDEVKLQELDSSNKGSKEYKVMIGKQVFYFQGDVYPMNLNESYFDRLFIFREIKKAKSDIVYHKEARERIYVKDILGNCDAIESLKKKIKKIALSSSTVLILGESGTGKEMFARAIHNEGNRKNEPFIAINCAAIPDALLESELFGYEKGAFTGANAGGRVGKFELANKGTIFLDEIGDMPMHLQTKILRVLQDKRIIKVGSNKAVDIDVRVIAATNKNLIKLIEENKFREDLYYRLNVIPFNIPPLRERIQDIKILVNHFIDKYTKLLKKEYSSIIIDEEVWEVFHHYSWPGNIRELENAIEFMINMLGPDGRLSLDTVPESILNNTRKIKKSDKDIHPIKELEKKEILKALEIYGVSTQSKKIIAKKLGIGIATLYRKLEEYNIYQNDNKGKN
ncbi:Limonene hydroxylase [Clostridium thermopalmarium DSM 5974]|uniref:Limonene hydroxylase n=3 Tax=Clostridiaceae TaxID=31979 RepID=A0A151AMR8_9CLOT|nr:limonene hydroxylase [Clostridium colicanis DSM 13634]PRR73179.1 Limonene hydroxylase [Clostridium thermopalmarium DSM 5974]PVZ25256.1 transcriptional regulator with PAS, ATPase and Fis domain [Clostridium thermopalmarium DSM 5974]